MSTSPIRFLQQESARLQKENQALQEQVQTLERYIDAMAELHWAVQRMPGEANPFDLLDRCMQNIRQVVGAQDGSFSRLDPQTGELVFAVVHGMLQKMLVGRRMKADVGVMGWVMENAQAVIVNEPRQDWRFSREIDTEFSFLTRSIICAPVMRQGQPVGVIELLNKEPRKFSKSDTTVLAVLCDVAAAALEQVQLRSG
jgi:GAF domain-containing protein